jgi:hypothetical protein
MASCLGVGAREAIGMCPGLVFDMWELYTKKEREESGQYPAAPISYVVNTGMKFVRRHGMAIFFLQNIFSVVVPVC